MAIDIIAAIFVVSTLGVVYVFNLCMNMRRYRRRRASVEPRRITLANQSHF
jgi:hypothetical protein